jgi:hypothetical protein
MFFHGVDAHVNVWHLPQYASGGYVSDNGMVGPHCAGLKSNQTWHRVVVWPRYQKQPSGETTDPAWLRYADATIESSIGDIACSVRSH